MKKVTLLALLCVISSLVRAAYTPVSLSGYNADIVSNGTVSAMSSISSFMTSGFDSAGYALVAQDYDYASYTPDYSLPTSGTVSSALTAGLTYQLADFSSNNALRLTHNGDTASLYFNTPQVAGALYMCGLSGSGISSFNATVNFSDGTTQTFSSLSYPDWYASGGCVVGIGRVSTSDNHTEGSSTAPSLFERMLAIDPSNYTKTIVSITIQKTSTAGFLGIMAVSAEDICSGTPTAGTVSAVPATGCTAFTSSLSLSGSTAATGITYQWQNSTDGVSWTNILGATDLTYSASVADSAYYRAYVTCTISGNSDTTAATHLAVITPVATVATLPFTESFESWIGSCFVADRPGVNWLTDPATGNNSWRRYDQGADASWTSLGNGGFSPSSTAGSYSARFHSYYASDGSTGDMDLHIDLSPAGTKQISFDYHNASGSDELDVMLSEDGGATFTTLGTYGSLSGWASEVLTTTSTASNAIIRFHAISDYGSTDIAMDNLSIILLTECAGMPTAGTISATTTTGCDPYTSTVSIDAPISMTGITYQWQSSTDGVIFTDLLGETNTSYNASVSFTTYYRAYVTCAVSGMSDTTNVVTLNYVVPTATAATLPFFESFESWIGSCYAADRPGVNWLNSPSSGNNSWRRYDQGADASWTSLGNGGYTPNSTDGSYSARFHSYYAGSGTIGNMDLYVDLSPAGSKQITFDYHNTDGSDYLDVQLSEDGGATFTSLGTFGTVSGWQTENITTTSTAANAILRFSATSDYGNTDIGVDSLYIDVLPSCSGTPVAGTASATVVTGCSPYTSTLSVDAPIFMTGVGYQWQSSTDGVIFSDILGATSPSYTTGDISANTYYRFYVTCSISSMSDTSAPIELMYVTPTASYATLPFFESFESWIGTCFAADRPGNNWILTPTSGDDSWRRNDQGADASWSGSSAGGSYSPTATDGSYSARFHSYLAPSGSQGSMDLYVDLSPAGTKQINFDYHNNAGPDNLQVQLSEDGGATFTTLLTVGAPGDFWAPQTITTNSTSATAILRFLATSDDGGSDIGVDSLSIVVLPGCTGTPVAGTINATSTTGCSPYTSTLSVATPELLTGISYQWQSSTDGVIYSDVFGATSTSYTTPDISSNTYYRFYVVCATSGGADTSAAIELMYVVPTATTATLPFFEGFENWIGSCFNYDRPGINWLTSPASGNDAWRRDDQGADASWTYISSGMYSPVSAEGSHSARFHTYEAPDGDVGSMDLHIDLSPAGSKSIKFDYKNSNSDDGADVLYVMLSEDGGSTFTTIGTFPSVNADWTPETIITSSTAANAVIRFQAQSDFGYTDIGLDSLYVDVLPSCTGTPVAGTISATETTSCSPFTTTLSVDAPIILTGISYQWQVQAGGSPWIDILGATNTTYTTDISSNVNFRVYVMCSTSGGSDTSNVISMIYTAPTPTYATVPYFESFENWLAGCAAYDRPGLNWLIDPTTGNNSWRRNDQGSDASWDVAGSGGYTPVSTHGSHSARFHTYEAEDGSVGSMYLYIDLSTPGTKTISFDYNNSNSDGGTDQLTVSLSEDGTGTYTTLGTYDAMDPGWHTQTITTTSVAPHAIIRFSATSDFGNTDIGIDSLYITAPVVAAGCDSPVTISVADVTETGATVSWSTVTGSAGYQYVINTTAAGPITGGTATTDTFAALTGLAAGTTYYVHVRTECTSGDSSGWATSSFTTLPAPCNPVTGVSTVVVTSTSVLANWSSVAGSTGYDYIVNTTSTDPAVTGTATTDTFAYVGGLTPSTTYYVHVRTDCSIDSAGWVTTTFTTLPPCQPITGLTITSVSATTVQGSWNHVSGGVAYEYTVTISAADPSGTGIPTTDTTASVGGLTPGTTYYLHVRTDCSGDSAGWVTTTFTTLPPCQPITGLAITSVTETSVQGIWNSVAGGVGYEYVITTSVADPTGTGIPTTDTTASVAGLTGGTSYYLHVRTDCSGDSSGWVTINFTTLPSTVPCGPVSGLAATAITDTTATVSWGAVSAISGYEYAVDLSVTPPASGTFTTATSVNLTPLVCATTYYLHVRTDCTSDTSAWNTISFMTAPCGTTGIQTQLAGAFNVEAYPNPVTDKVTVEVTGAMTGDATIRLTDVAGKVISELHMSSSKADIYLNNVASGIYFLHYSDDANKRTIKINKQ